MAGTDFTIYTRFNSGNSGAYAGSTIITPYSGNNPQSVDKIVDTGNSGGLVPGVISGDFQITEGLNKVFTDLGAQSATVTSITEPIATVGAVSLTIASVNNIAIGSVLEFAVGGEQVLVTEIAGLVLTITRGHNGTTPATHLDNAVVNVVPTNINGGGFGLQASLTSGQTTVTAFTVVIKFYKVNDDITTITDALVDIVGTAINVASASNISIGSVLLIDAEKFLVTDINSLALTVTRGHGGTTAATHTDNEDVSVTTLIKSYTLTETSTSVARDAIQLSADFGVPVAGDRICQVDVTPDPDDAIVEIIGVLNWNS